MPDSVKLADIYLRLPEEDVKYILDASKKYHYSPGSIVHEILREHIRNREKKNTEK